MIPINGFLHCSLHGRHSCVLPDEFEKNMESGDTQFHDTKAQPRSATLHPIA